MNTEHKLEFVKNKIKTEKNKLKKLAQKNTGNSYSMEELDHAIELTSNEPNKDNEKKILKGIVKFGNISVRSLFPPFASPFLISCSD